MTCFGHVSVFVIGVEVGSSTEWSLKKKVPIKARMARLWIQSTTTRTDLQFVIPRDSCYLYSSKIHGE